MAEPAPIYDQDKKEPVTHPDLQVLEGGDSQDSRNRNQDQVGRGYVDPEKQAHGKLTAIGPSVRGVVKFAKTNRGKLILGGAAASFLTLLIVGFFALIPFKILHIVNNLQNRFFATSEAAVQQETDQMFSQYLKKYVFPSKCRSTIDKNCNPQSIIGTNPVSRMYKSWSQAHLENTLATKYGIEFKYSHAANHYYIRAPGLTNDLQLDDSFITDSESLDDYISRTGTPQWQKVNRAQLRQAVRDSLANETQWKRVMYRFKVGRLLEEKYGIRRCIIFCGTKDALADKANTQKNAAKIFLSQRVIQPRSQSLGIVLTCLFDDTCDPTKPAEDPLQHNCTPGVDCAISGSPESTTDSALRSNLDSLAAKYGAENSDELLKIYNDISEKGISRYMMEQTLSKVFGTTASDIASKKISDLIPVVGWINLAAEATNVAHDTGPKLKKLSYMVNSTAAVSLFAMYRTYADEIKTGNVNATEVGSLINSLGSTQASDKSMGGTASAEQTPLYNSLIGGGSGAGSRTYTCNDGSQVPAGSKVCQEEVLGQGNNIANGVNKYVDSVPGLTEIASVWKNSVGVLFKAVSGVVNVVVQNLIVAPLNAVCGLGHLAQLAVPGAVAYCGIKDAASSAAESIMKVFVEHAIPNPISNNMSGGRTFDMMAGGADISGNDYAHSGLGGSKLSDQQATAMVNDQREQDLLHYKSQPLLTRLFDTNSQYSPVSRLAMALPADFASAESDFASFFANPLSPAFSLLSAILGHASAATAQPDPFGIVQYGYTSSDIQQIGDAEKYWDNHCADNPEVANGSKTKNWNVEAASHVNDSDNLTGMPVNTTSNPCLLIQAATGSAGGIYPDSGLLTPDDQAGP